jgi:WD40 repeat protein
MSATINPRRWQQVQALFDAALAKGPDERAAFLLEACAGDAALQAEVLALLAHADQVERDNFLPPPSAPTARSADDAPGAALPPPLPGCEFLGELGRGGMGVIYQVWQTHLNRKVALKVISAAACAGPEGRARFRTEAEALARLQHPNIVQIHDLGEYDGQPYLVLELVEGGSLSRKLAGAPLPPPAAARLVETLAQAMHYAHSRGIVHRDLTPANVLLAADGTPKITDFGLAKKLDEVGQTQSGAIMGTASYMAPEQARGQSKEIGPRTDVYALGAILYECLTGRPPFKAATTLDTLQQVTQLDPVPPRQLQPGMPRDLETICLKCLEKQPSRRYPGAADLADDLRRFLDGESIHARPAGRAEQAVKWTRRHPARAVLVAAGAAIVLGLVGYVVQRQRDYDEVKSARDRALEREADARLARYTARMRLASQMLNSGDLLQLPDLLDPYQQPADQASPSGDDFRGFEWWYLRQYRQQVRPPLMAHDGPIHFLAYSADGRALLTAGQDPGEPALAVWDLAGAKPRWRHKFKGAERQALAASAPGGGVLAGVQLDDRTIALWDVATGKERQHLPAWGVTRVGLSPDGRRLITGAARGPLDVRDTTTGEQRLQLSAAVGPLAVAPDGRTLLVGGHTEGFRGLEGWDLQTGERLWQVPVAAGVSHLSCSPRGAYLLVITGGGQGALWGANERQPLDWPQPFGAVQALAISPDERTVAAGDMEGGVRLWDVATRRLRARYRWQANPIVRLAFSPDGRSLAAASYAGVVYQVDATACTVPETLRPEWAPCQQAPVWSPDGKTVAVGLSDNTIQLVDVPTRRSRCVLPCSQNFAVRAMAFSPDGQTLATVAWAERAIRLWDAASGRLKSATASQPVPIESLAFSPDGQRLAAALGTGTIRLWDATSLTESGVLESAVPPRQVAFTPDSRYLVAAGDAELQVWDLTPGHGPRQPRCTVRPEHGASCVAVAPDGRRIAVGEADCVVEFWRLSQDGELTRDLPPLRCGGGRPGPHQILGLQFGPGGTTLLTTVRGGTADLWDIPSGRCSATMAGDLEYGALSPDGDVLAGRSRDGTLQLWDRRTWRVARLAGQPLGPVTSLAFPAGGGLVTGSKLFGRGGWIRKWGTRLDYAPLGRMSDTVRLWDVATGREVVPSGLVPQDTMTSFTTAVTCSPDGRTVAAGSEDGGVWLWDRGGRGLRPRLFVSAAAQTYARSVETARALSPFLNPDYPKKTEAVEALAFSPDGDCLATAGNHGSVRVWRTNDWKESRTLPCDRVPVAWVGFAPDSRRLATAQGGQVRLWDTRTGELAGTLGSAAEPPILAGVFLPGGRLATGSRDHVIRLWDLDTGKVTGRFVGHQDRVTALAITPDGKTLASASWDRTVRLWSMADASAVATLEGHAGKVQALAFSPDGQVLASGSDAGDDTGEVLLWRAKRP